MNLSFRAHGPQVLSCGISVKSVCIALYIFGVIIELVNLDIFVHVNFPNAGGVGFVLRHRFASETINSPRFFSHFSLPHEILGLGRAEMAKKAFRKTWAIQSNQTQSIRLSMDPFHTNLRGYDVNQCDV